MDTKDLITRGSLMTVRLSFEPHDKGNVAIREVELRASLKGRVRNHVALLVGGDLA